MDNSEQKKEASNNDIIIISNNNNNSITNINDINPLKRPAADNSPTSTSNSDEDDDQVHNNESGNGSKMDHVDDQIKKQMKNKDSNFIKQGGDLESTKAEMGEVMEENQRLKKHLDQIMNDYQVLQMKYYQVSQQQQDSNKKPKHTTNNATPPPPRTMEDEDEAELVSLSLGRSSSLDSKSIINNKLNSIIHTNKERGEGGANSSNNNSNNNTEEANERSLDLGLEYSRLSNTSLDHPRLRPLIPRSSPDNSFEESREGESGGGGKETWTPSTMTKNNTSTNSSTKSGDDEVVQQPLVKKARVSVRARCDTPTMNDGCQWRKYGQKIAKGNPCPRAYYRCTVAPLCPVRKQVQRCAEDMSILITTYEGAHNHPLPISATAMASTTSAAAYMLMSGSSTSSSNNQGSHNHIRTTTIPPSTRSSTDLHTGLNFNILDNSNPNLNPPFYSSTTTSFAPPPTHPTITLDLTSTTTSVSSTTQFNNRVCNTGSTTPSTFVPRYSSTNLNFHSLDSSNSPWPTNNNSLLSYSTQPYNNKTHHNQDHNNNLFNLHNLLPKSNLGSNNLPNNQQQQPLPDTIAQAAKVLTSDPNFQSVLSAALSSFISSSNNNNGNNGAGITNSNGGRGESNNGVNHGSEFAQKMIKWGSNNTAGGVHTISSSSTTLNSTLQSTSNNKGNTSANGCGSSLLNMAPSSTTNSQHGGSLMFLTPPLPLSASKSTSTSPSDNRDHAI